MNKRLYLLRHGQTVLNVGKLIQGSRNDSPLTELGINQALKAKEYLEKNNYKFDSIYSSTLPRAITTTTLVTNKKPIEVEGLKEIDFGDLTGHDYELTHQYNKGFKDFGGESYEDGEKRFEDTLKTIADREKGQNILCVTHGLCIKLLYCKLTGASLDVKVLNNLGIMVVDYDGQNFKFIENIDTQI